MRRENPDVWHRAAVPPAAPAIRTMMTTTTSIRVRLNGERMTTTTPTLAALLDEQGYAGRKVATARNGEFVAERQRAATRLADGDEIEVVSPRQGG